MEYGYWNCEVSVHFMGNRVMHELDISSCKSYTASLKNHINIIMIEQVDVSRSRKALESKSTGVEKHRSRKAQESKSRLRECKKREWYWQNQLKSLRQYEGMNILEERL